MIDFFSSFIQTQFALLVSTKEKTKRERKREREKDLWALEIVDKQILTLPFHLTFLSLSPPLPFFFILAKTVSRGTVDLFSFFSFNFVFQLASSINFLSSHAWTCMSLPMSQLFFNNLDFFLQNAKLYHAFNDLFDLIILPQINR